MRRTIPPFLRRRFAATNVRYKHFTAESLYEHIMTHLENDNRIRKQNLGRKPGDRFKRPLFPSDISESIVRLLYGIIYDRNKPGDIHLEGKLGEIKCMSSDVPISFGYKQKWDILFIVDARRYDDGFYTVYRFDVSSDDPLFQNLPVNKKGDTYGSNCEKNKSSMIKFSTLFSELGKAEHVTVPFDGHISKLIEVIRLVTNLTSNSSS